MTPFKSWQTIYRAGYFWQQQANITWPRLGLHLGAQASPDYHLSRSRSLITSVTLTRDAMTHRPPSAPIRPHRPTSFKVLDLNVYSASTWPYITSKQGHPARVHRDNISFNICFQTARLFRSIYPRGKNAIKITIKHPIQAESGLVDTLAIKRPPRTDSPLSTRSVLNSAAIAISFDISVLIDITWYLSLYLIKLILLIL